MAMEVVQLLHIITIYYPTLLYAPDIYLELVNDTVLYTRINRRIQFHAFEDEVHWPGNVTVTIKGVLGMTFEKKVHKHWENPFTPLISPITNHDVPKFWNYTILSKKEELPDYYILTIRPQQRMYFHYCIGYFIAFKRSFFSPRHQRVVYNTKQYSPVPTLPLKTMEDPNKPPGKWRSMLMNVNILVRATPKHSFGHWLAKKAEGESVLVTEPYGSLFFPMFDDVEHLHLVTAKSGVTAMLEVILCLLQITKIRTIQLIYFNKHDKLILFKEGLTSISMLDQRLIVRHIISDPSEEWKGLTGVPSKELIEKFIPKFIKNSTTFKHYCGICGTDEFFKNTERILLDGLKYPWVRIHHFDGE